MPALKQDRFAAWQAIAFRPQGTFRILFPVPIEKAAPHSRKTLYDRKTLFNDSLARQDVLELEVRRSGGHHGHHHGDLGHFTKQE
jgi:hypothetical protein